MEKKTLAGEIEEHHGTTEHTSAQCGLCDLLFQRHLLHPCGGGGQPAAGTLWVCLWNDRQTAVAAEHRQPAGWIPDRCAAGGVRRCHPDAVGIVSEKAGLAAGMASNIVPCVGLVLFTLLVARLPEE